MKKQILVILLTLSSIASAQVKKGKVATYGEARRETEIRTEYKNYRDAISSGKMTVVIRQAMMRTLSESLSSAKGVDLVGLESFTSIRPEGLIKIVELSTLLENGTAIQKEKALTDLRILAEGSKLLDSSSTQAKVEAEALEKVTEMSDYNAEAKSFKAELSKELRKGGITVSQAVDKASKGKITLEKIKSCVL